MVCGRLPTIAALTVAVLLALAAAPIAAPALGEDDREGRAAAKPARKKPTVKLTLDAAAADCGLLAKVKNAPKRSKLVLEADDGSGWQGELTTKVKKGKSKSELDCSDIAGGAEVRALLKRGAKTIAKSKPVELPDTTPPPDTTAPETTIDSGPSGTINTDSATFAFSASEPGSSFECSLDGAPFATCTSPKGHSALADGAHSFKVRASDAAANTDQTPAERSFTVDTAPSPGTAKAVSAGGYHTCAVRLDDSLDCWGLNTDGQATPPAGSFKAVDGGAYHTCAVRSDNSIACWGEASWGQATPPAGSFKDVGAGDTHSCAIKSDDTLVCWGDDSFGQATPPAGTYKSLDAGAYHNCAIKTDDTIACWGWNNQGQSSAPAGTFKAVSAGSLHSCAIKTDNTLACWGSNSNGQATPPAGSFKAVSAGAYYTCAIKADDTAACWGQSGAFTSIPGGVFLKVITTGYYHTCAIKLDDAVQCWQ